MIFSVAFVTLIISSLAKTLLDINAFESAKYEQAQSIVAAMSQSFVRLLTLGDVDVAADIGAHFDAFPEIKGALILNTQGEPLLRFGEESPAVKQYGLLTVLRDDLYSLSFPIVYQDQTFGTIQLSMSTAGIKQDIIEQLYISASIFVLTLALSFLIAVLLQRRFTKPIIQLSNLIDSVSPKLDMSNDLDGMMRDEMGKIHSGVMQMLNTVEEKTREVQLERDRLSITLESITDGVITTNHTGSITYLNSIAEQMTGYKKKYATGKFLSDIFSLINEISMMPYEGYLNRCLAFGQTLIEYDNISLVRADHNLVPIQLSISPIQINDETAGCVVVFRNITEYRELSRQLNYQAKHDGLTGLLNRLEFEQRMSTAIHAIRPGHQHVFLYVDLDQFKIVNDLSGHIAGDALLKQVAHFLTSHVRNTDIVARFGGDEFGILLFECDTDKATRIANNIIKDISQFSFVWENQNFKIGASIGMVTIDSEAVPIIDILRDADIACYSAKEHGRNRVHLHQVDDSVNNLRQGELYWISRLNDAIKDENFLLYLQQIFPINEQSDVQKYEVLLRMKENDNNVIMPSAFLPSAERYGLIDYIDHWVIENLIASDTYKNVTMENPAAQFNINLSGKSLNNKNLSNFIFNLFKRYNIYPRNICFEITETAAIANFAEAIKFAQSMRSVGCQIALDDFGSGLSSFAYLKNLPVDYLKIDGSFIHDIDKSPINFAMVRSINELGQIMGIKTVAEGVESSEAMARLRSIAINYAQGFFLHEPEPLNKRQQQNNVIGIKPPRQAK